MKMIFPSKKKSVEVQVVAPKIRNVKMSSCGSYLSFEANWSSKSFEADWCRDVYTTLYIYNTPKGLVYVDPGFLQTTHSDIDALLWNYELQELKPYWKPTSKTEHDQKDFHSQDCMVGLFDLFQQIENMKK